MGFYVLQGCNPVGVIPGLKVALIDGMRIPEILNLYLFMVIFFDVMPVLKGI